ncbi:helix-turn-helix domain-containing protein [Candidatus Woesearchaeota archaeon]|nr:helix-turn-helix domain-containing protein [Candidatus Woesearchaeota archaeon]
MKLTEKQRYEIRKFVRELESYKGRHTELVSVYIPADYDLNKIINHLSQEQGTASNIKSTSTRKNVQDALERMIQHLRLFKRTPDNGLISFSGNVSEREGQSDVRVWSMEPPIPLRTRIYRCDKEFVLDALRDMLEDKEVYGMIVLDRRDAHIAVLRGKTITVLLKTHSEVPGKFKAGGQCLAKDAVVQCGNGNLLKIEDVHNPVSLAGMYNHKSIASSPVTDKWVVRKSKVYNVVTKRPRLSVNASGDHTFFILKGKGIVEKRAKDLKAEDVLIMPEKLDIKGEVQMLDSKKYYNSFTVSNEGRKFLRERRGKRKQSEIAKTAGVAQTTISSCETGKIRLERNTLKRICRALEAEFESFVREFTSQYEYKAINLPNVLDVKFARFLGYLLGDGTIEEDRVTFFEQRYDVASDYQNEFESYFGMNSSLKFRKGKNYYQLRFTSRPLVRVITNEFPEIQKGMIPEKILKSSSEIVGSFLRGFFDAEGYVSVRGQVAAGINNEVLSHEIQMVLLRLGIISSLHEYDNRSNPYSSNVRYTIDITEKQSLVKFAESVGLTSREKKDRLRRIILRKSTTSYVRQMLVPGREIRRIIEDAGYNLQLFPKVNNFFRNERGMGKQVFLESILFNVKDEKLRKKLLEAYNLVFLPVEISSIEIKECDMEMIDISVESGNFIANGLLVHNSAPRFARQREGAAKEHYKKVAEYAKEKFLTFEGLKGIIVGGPGPTKYDFVEGGFLTDQLLRKVIAIKDLSYTGEFGLQELLDKSQDVLANEEVSKEKQIMGKFFELLARKPGMVAYGEKDVMEKLVGGVVDIVLLSEAVSEEKVLEFEKEATKQGSTITIISVETREGVQLRDMGMYAAILRYDTGG